MKKLLISISLLLVLVVAIVACNNNENEEPTSGSTTPQVTETPTEDETEPPTTKPEETTPKEDPTTADEDPTTKEEETTVEEETGWSEVANVPGMSPDNYYENGEMVSPATGGAHTWLPTNRPDGIIVDSLSTFGFRGWAGLGDKEIAEFGYALGDKGEAVWSADWVKEPESNLPSATGQPNVKRYEIMIDTADIKGGEYDLYLLVKATDGTVYRLNVWGDLKVVRTVYTDVSEKWNSSVDMINGKGATSDAPNFSGRGGNSDKGVDTIDTFVQPTTTKITIDGWVGLTGGVSKYIWTVDGEVWYDAGPGVDGEPAPDHFKDMEDATIHAMFKGSNALVADLSAYKWQTVDVTFAAVSKADNTKIAKFLTIKGVKVPGGTERPDVTESSTIDLGLGEQGNPLSAGGTFGQKFTVKEGQWLDTISIISMATYENNETVGTVKIWVWDTDYATTTAKDPIFEQTIEGHKDNETLIIDVSSLNLSNCTLYYEAGATTGNWTAKVAKDGNAEGVETYLNGKVFDQSFCAKITVSTEVTDDLLLDVDFDALDPSAVTSGAPDGGLMGPDHAEAVAAGITTKWARMHLGSINLGTLDLSKYNYVKIRYVFDGSKATQEKFEDMEHTRIGLVTKDMKGVNDPFANEAEVIAYTDYTFSSASWGGARYAIIDLSEIDYSGEVYISLDTIGGTFVAIDAIEFYGEKADEEETPDAGEENPDAGEDTSGEEAEA